MIIVSDTSPICYLLLTGHINILQELYGVVTIPQVVADELSAAESLPAIKSWITQPPSWLQIQTVEASNVLGLDKLDPGEREAILLAEQIDADLVILDDKAARRIATQRGLKIIGLLGILKDASRAGLLDLATTFESIQQAGFRVAPNLLEQLLKDD